jgi:hypothetical protein
VCLGALQVLHGALLLKWPGDGKTQKHAGFGDESILRVGTACV